MSISRQRIAIAALSLSMLSLGLSAHRSMGESPSFESRCGAFSFSPTPGRDLESVDELSANDAWSVGHTTTGSSSDFTITTLVNRWDGQTWTSGGAIDPGGAYISTFYGVSAISDSDVWAVGCYSTGSRDRDLVEHWDGREWTQIPIQTPGGPHGSGILRSVTAIAADDVWAVGSAQDTRSDIISTSIQHWDGTEWTQIPSPNVFSRNYLFSVSAAAPDDVWAVGDSYAASTSELLLEHWNGRHWSLSRPPTLKNPSTTILGVTAVSPSDVWAVGESYTANGSSTLILNWSGSRWRRVPSPNRSHFASNRLYSVAAGADDNAWVVGASYHSHRHAETIECLTEHWDGAEWALESCPGGHSDSVLASVSTVSPVEALAVGYWPNSTHDGTQELRLDWDGSAWSRG